MTDHAPYQDDGRLKRLKDSLIERLGPQAIIDQPDDLVPYVTERRGRYKPQTPFVVRPASTQEVSETLKLCTALEVPIVPQGGNTGLVGGGVPYEGRGEVILNLGRMDKIRSLDPDNYSITVEAGCILQRIQEAAADVDRLFPLSLGAEGSCQIGGNLSTNAGGIHVIRYGNMRDLVLGVEAVLPDGRIWNGLRSLRKDNTGYDLKQLFIGGEGTLGVVTAAVLKLFARPRETAVAFVAVQGPEAAVKLLGDLRRASGEAVLAFEIIPRIALDFALKHVAGTIDPLGQPAAWYILVELAAGRPDSGLGDLLEEALSEAFESELVLDATVARSEAQAQQIWFIREAIVEAQKHEGGSIKHDVSVPVAAVPRFLELATAKVREMIPGIRPVPFGHLGDGNIHFNLSQPLGADREAYLAQWEVVNEEVHTIVHALGGSISAEHGLGRLKLEENKRFKEPIELEMMRAIKAVFDPKGLMNPGKMID